MTPRDIFIAGLIVYGLTVIRYLLLAGGAYLVLWVWRQHRFAGRRIQRRIPSKPRMRSEILYSLSTASIFATTATFVFYATAQGWTAIYFRVSDHGVGYFVLSIAIALLAHDTYFYWTHRLMHWPGVFKHVHRAHHLSRSPTPWAAYAFHPLEALIHIVILPMIAFLLPIHYAALFVFMSISFANNVLGHLGFELFPSCFARHRVFGWLTTTTHHDIHHEKFTWHYGLYFRWWDRLMGTSDPDYTRRFTEITERAGAAVPARVRSSQC